MPAGEAASSSSEATTQAAADETAVWLKGTRLDEGQFQRDRLKPGLVADQTPAPYSDDSLTDRTNAESGPYKSPSQELLEKARARALEAGESKASEPQGETPAQSAVAPRQPTVAPSSPQQTVTASSGPGSTDTEAIGESPGVAGGSSQNPAPAKVAASEERTPDPSPEPAVTPVRQAALTGGAIRIQLSSVRLLGDAQREGSRLRTLYSEILGGRDVFTERVDLGAQGIYHRIQFGPFKDFSTAEQVCRRLKALRQDCFVLTGRAAGDNG